MQKRIIIDGIKCRIDKRKRSRPNRKYRNPFHEKLGISEEKYYILCESQNWRCAICGTIPEKKLCVDHCHITNVFRGLLCGLCNTGLGFFRDDIMSLSFAIDYLINQKAR